MTYIEPMDGSKYAYSISEVEDCPI